MMMYQLIIWSICYSWSNSDDKLVWNLVFFKFDVTVFYIVLCNYWIKYYIITVNYVELSCIIMIDFVMSVDMMN